MYQPVSTSQYALLSVKISVELYLKILKKWTKQVSLSKMQAYSIFNADFRWVFLLTPLASLDLPRDLDSVSVWYKFKI